SDGPKSGRTPSSGGGVAEGDQERAGSEDRRGLSPAHEDGHHDLIGFTPFPTTSAQRTSPARATPASTSRRGHCPGSSGVRRRRSSRRTAAKDSVDRRAGEPRGDRESDP